MIANIETLQPVTQKEKPESGVVVTVFVNTVVLMNE